MSEVIEFGMGVSGVPPTLWRASSRQAGIGCQKRLEEKLRDSGIG